MRRALVAAVLALCACATTAEQQKPAEPEQKVEPAAKPAPAEAKTAQPPTDIEPWRAQPPKPGPSPELVIPTFQKAVLPNGLTVLVSERHDLPLVSLAVAFSAGTAQDPEGKAGLADLTYRLLLEGAGKRDAIALEEAFSDLGGQPYTQTRADGALVGTRVLTRNAPRALELLSDIALHPQMKQAGFELKKKQMLDTLAQLAGDPTWLAQWAFAQELYGTNHPYGQIGSGTPESVSALTLKDARDFWAKWSGPKGAALVVTGDVTLDQAKQWAAKYFGKWKGKAARPPVPPAVQPDATRQLVLVPKAGLVQTIVAMGRVAIPSGHPDEPALQLASTIFGGFFGSRLNMNLREAKGYSYGAYAYVDPRRGEGPLVASSKVRADVTGPALQVFLEELKGLQVRPITDDELSAAREGLIQSLPGSFATVEDLTRAAAGLYWEDKALDHYQQLVTKLEAATSAQVQQVAEKYFNPVLLDVVLVGDPDLVTKQVQPLGLGELVVRQPPKGAAPAAKK
ncbi:MAG: insulinase family protein [Myxococcaceae bacterium]|nr:insulinase family protein [Myxococcaceae bacterium]